MKPQAILATLALLVFATWAELSWAHVVAAPVPLLMDHPVGHAGPRTQALWRRSAGHWGENIAEQSLRLRGYSEVLEVKSGTQGIDRIGLRRNAAGELSGVRIVEVKVHRGGNVARLGETKQGRQMSRTWLAHKLRQMRSSPDPQTRQLATEIFQFRKSQNVPVVQLGEIHEINTRTARYTVRRPGTGQVLLDETLDRHLSRLGRRAQTPAAREWARVQRSRLPRITETKMSVWLSPEAMTGQQRALSRTGAVGSARAMKRLTLKAAGPLGAAAALTYDMHTLHLDWRAYQAGEISQKTFRRSVAGTTGGAAGAAAGGYAGGYFGIQIGTLGGPVAWITVPASGFLGAGIGGVGGYFIGRSSAQRLVDTWYGRMDRTVQDGFERWLIRAATGANADEPD